MDATMRRLTMRVVIALLCCTLGWTGASTLAAPASPPATRATAIFAGGCFWCTEADFEKLPGVISAVSGYTGGRVAAPTYEQVSAGGTGHTEAVKVTYDPARVSYAQLVEYFWRTIDPTVRNRQFCDHGDQYRTAIFHASDEEKRIVLASRDALLRAGKVPVIHTEVARAARFWPAEGYHQDYAKKNPVRYRFYRLNCGRDERLEEIWGPAVH
jgi:peptide-methionine (S)-S-oxide reductase